MWARVDDGWWCHPKVLELSLTARGLWVTALSWSCQQRREIVPGGMVRMFGATDQEAGELVAAGLWEAVEGGWLFHDWAEYQQLSTSEKRAEAGRKGGEASGKQRRSKPPASDEAGSPVPGPGPFPSSSSQDNSQPRWARMDDDGFDWNLVWRRIAEHKRSTRNPQPSAAWVRTTARNQPHDEYEPGKTFAEKALELYEWLDIDEATLADVLVGKRRPDHLKRREAA